MTGQAERVLSDKHWPSRTGPLALNRYPAVGPGKRPHNSSETPVTLDLGLGPRLFSECHHNLPNPILQAFSPSFLSGFRGCFWVSLPAQ